MTTSVDSMFGARGAQPKTLSTTQMVLPSGSVPFVLRTVPPERIDEDTFVSARNPRLQEFLNEASVADLLPTLREVGQTRPAYGRLVVVDGVERIEIADGSRRRAGCRIAQRPYRVWVAKTLSDEDMEHLIRVSVDGQRPLSLLELGRRLTAFVSTSEGPVSQPQLVKRFGVNLAIVNVALRSASLPVELFAGYAAVHEIGRRTLTTLLTLWAKADEHERQALLRAAQRIKEEMAINGADSPDLVRHTKRVTDALIASVAPPKTDAKSDQTVRDSELIPGRIRLRSVGDEHSVTIKGATESQLAQLSELIRTFFADEADSQSR